MDDPERIGDYAIARKLGSGGQGVVYEAYDPAGERVALKLLHGAAGIARPVEKEIAAARRVAAFCTARVIAVDLTGARPYVVSEFVDGPSLTQAVADQGPFEADALRRLAVGVATAMAAIHDAGVVHCDLKPDNVLLGPDGPRVIDFGIARIVDSSLTASRGVIGTPGYMAPELFSGGHPTAAADVFAWGAVMVFAASGRAPFAREHVAAVINDVLRSEADLGALTEPLRSWVGAALSKDPARRPTAHELLIGLLSGEHGRLSAAMDEGREVAAPIGVRVSRPPLGDLAEDAFAQVPADARPVAEQLLLRMLDGDRLVGVDPAELGDSRVFAAVDVLTARKVLRARDGEVVLGNPALRHAWPRLRELIAEERAGLATYQRLRDATRTWDRHGRRENDLYDGAALESATFWAATLRRRLELTPAERDFLAGSGGLGRKRLRRRRALTFVLVVLLVATTGLAALAEINRRGVEQAQVLAVAREQAARAETLRDTDPAEAMRLTVTAARGADLPETRAALLGSLAQPSLARRTTRAVGLGQDGRSLVEVRDGTAVISDAATGKRLTTVPGIEGDVVHAWLSGDRRWLASMSCGDQFCRENARIAVRRTSDGRQTGAATIREQFLEPQQIWFDASNRLVRRTPCGRPGVLVGRRTPGTLAGCADDTGFGVHDLATGRIVSHRRPTGGRYAEFATLSPDRGLLAVQLHHDADDRSPIQMWAVDDRGVLVRDVAYAAHPDYATPTMDSGSNECGPTSLVFDESGERLAGERCGLVAVWNRVGNGGWSPTMPAEYEPGTVPMEVVASVPHPVGARLGFSPDGGTLTLASEGEVRLLDTSTMARPGGGATTFDHLRTPRMQAAFSPDGALLAIMDQSELRLIGTRTGEVIAGFREPWVSPEFRAPLQGGGAPPMVFSPDGRVLAVNGAGAEVVLIDTGAGRVLRTITLPHARKPAGEPGLGDLLAMAFSPDGSLVAAITHIEDETSPNYGSSLLVWRVRDGERVDEVKEVIGHTLTFAADGATLYVGHPDHGVCTVRPAAGQTDCGFRMPGYVTENLARTPDGGRLLLGVADGSLAIWNPRTREVEDRVMRGHAAERVVTAAFSPDGTMLATGSDDDTVRLWDVRARRSIGLPFQHAGDLLAVAFDADGRTVRTADASGAVHAFPLDTPRMLEAVCRRVSCRP
ncbi:serine/threonine-protein kinase [Herbidospora daliensis]|uniref:serine/threonine-protein kinase n=1 Tax=Herbidospora daliensis TaxID=295585 RepID=UPI00078574D9|nr:serine/threonine-protein kinase [Herbidospora daliensis]